MVSRLSRVFSHRENKQPVELSDVTLLAQIRQRVKAALDLRRGTLTLREFAERIGQPSPSWRSEILVHERKPWPDKITLLVRAARVLGVSPGYLLGEQGRHADVRLDALLELWAVLKSEEREAVLVVVRGFLIARGIDPTRESSGGSPHGDSGANSRTRSGGVGSHKSKRPS